jgi:hypothetical protein
MPGRWTGLTLAATVLAGGCGSGATSPTPAPTGPVRVSVSALPTLAGGTALFAIRLDNISSSPVNLTFPSSCKLLPYFTDRAGRAVIPEGGGFACLAVVTQLTLSPGVSLIETYTVTRGTTPESPFIVLPPGEYTIRGRLEDTVYKLESEPLAFAVQ